MEWLIPYVLTSGMGICLAMLGWAVKTLHTLVRDTAVLSQKIEAYERKLARQEAFDDMARRDIEVLKAQVAEINGRRHAVQGRAV
jgi:hypothetical protein